MGSAYAYCNLNFSCSIFCSINRIVSRNASSLLPLGSSSPQNIGQQLTVLGFFHVDAVDLLHQPDGILVDLGLCFRTGRIAFKHIGSQLLA